MVWWRRIYSDDEAEIRGWRVFFVADAEVWSMIPWFIGRERAQRWKERMRWVG